MNGHRLFALHLAVALLTLLATACGGAPPDPDDGGADTPFARQVSRGGGLFGEHCARCHGDSGQGTDAAPRLVGLAEGALPLEPPPDAEVRTARFVTAGDVATFASMNMPADDPGSLALDEYLAILAFALFANGVVLEDELTLEAAGGLTIPR